MTDDDDEKRNGKNAMRKKQRKNVIESRGHARSNTIELTMT